MSIKIEVGIPRHYLSKRTEQAGVKMYFDAEIKVKDGDHEILSQRQNELRLVQGKNGVMFLGYTSTEKQTGDKKEFYPVFLPGKKLSDVILTAAEHFYLTKGQSK